jgi:hypothetical protein
VPLTLAQLRTAQTRADIRARIIARLTTAGATVVDWIPSDEGGVENSRVDMVANVIADLYGAKLTEIANGRFLEYATGDWLVYYAKRFYGIVKREATSTIQLVRLTSVATAPSYSFKPGELWVAGIDTGNKYRSLDAVKLAPGKSADARFQAENPGSSYADEPGTITQMVTAPAGVTCNNPRPSDFTPAVLSGSSTGTVTGSFADAAFLASLAALGLAGATDPLLAPPPIDPAFADPIPAPSFDSLRVRIITSGDIGTGSFEFSTDGGNHWTAGGPIPSAFLLPGNEAYLQFTNGIAPSFIQGDMFTMLVADSILQRGADLETEDSLRQRCRGRWPGLSLVPTGSTVDLWAHLASDEVSKVLTDADPDRPGGILVTIASQSGPASAAAVLAVRDYIAARLWGYRGVPAPSTAVSVSPEETCLVASATPREIICRGTVDVPRGAVTAVQVAAENLWLEYLRSVPIGGTVRVAELIQALMDGGCVDTDEQSIEFELSDPGGNIRLQRREVAISGMGLAASMIWRPV